MAVSTKAGLCVGLLTGLAAAGAPAFAGVSIGVGIGVAPPPSNYAAPPPPPYDPYCDRYSRWYDPYRCRPVAAYGPYDGYYYEPIFFNGVWYNGPLPYRYVAGVPEFFIGGAWRAHLHFNPRGFHGGREFHHR